MVKSKKIIGTLVPVSALYSLQLEKSDEGTFEAGLLFLDWLKKTKQSAWQFLPLHETQLEMGSVKIHVPSPYKTYGIGIDPKYASHSFAKKIPTGEEKNAFVKMHSEWILDYAVFCAIRDHAGTDDWRLWEPGLRDRDEETLLQWIEKLKREINHYIILQWQAHESFSLLKKKAEKSGIKFIGDIPFYLSVQSPLVWANQGIFQLEENGYLQFVSGIPQTPSAHFGRQLWGHPLYDWDKKGNDEKIIDFWKLRLKYMKLLFDVVRLDHAKAFFEYGSLNVENIEHDRFRKGPGVKVFEELVSYGKQNGLSLFVEDSGEKLAELRESSKKLKIPGIKIFRFAIDDKKGKVNKEYIETKNYPEDTVAYTTTHDTEPILGYLEKLTTAQKKLLSELSNVKYSSDEKEYAISLRKAVLNSPARIVIVPIQDWLLTKERINIPGTEIPVGDPNWHFKLPVPLEKLPDAL